MPKVRLLNAVTWNGSIVEAGEILELAPKSAESLVSDSIAEYAEISPESEETGAGNTTDTIEGLNASENENNATEDDKDVASKLDEKFKRDELATAAKEAGVEFAYDAKKAEIVAAVIQAGKADELLKA